MLSATGLLRFAFLLVFFLLHATQPAGAGSYAFTVRGDKTFLNGQEFLVKGLRCSNALISDQTTQDLIDNLDTFAGYGVNTISVYFMGSRFGDVKGYNEDATLNPMYAERMARIIEAADQRGMVVLVGCLYWSTSEAKWDSWTQAQANAAVANTVAWLKEKGYRNVFVDIDNEGMARAAKGFDPRQMVLAGKAADPCCVIATNFTRSSPLPRRISRSTIRSGPRASHTSKARHRPARPPAATGAPTARRTATTTTSTSGSTPRP